MGAKTLRNVRIAEIFAGKVLLEAIFGAWFGRVGALVSLPGKIWVKMGGNIRGKMRGKIRGKSMPKSMPKSTPKSMAIPRLISEVKSRKLFEIIEDV